MDPAQEEILMFGYVHSLFRWAALTVCLAILTVTPTAAQAPPDEPSFDNSALKGRFAWSQSGRFQDLVSQGPPTVMEFHDFAQTGYLDFNGQGGVNGAFNHVSQSASGGTTHGFSEMVGDYSVTASGLATISLDARYRDEWGYNADMTLACVIVKRRQLARCIITEIRDYQDLPHLSLPVTGTGSLERQKPPS